MDTLSSRPRASHAGPRGLDSSGNRPRPLSQKRADLEHEPRSVSPPSPRLGHQLAKSPGLGPQEPSPGPHGVRTMPAGLLPQLPGAVKRRQHSPSHLCGACGGQCSGLTPPSLLAKGCPPTLHMGVSPLTAHNTVAGFVRASRRQGDSQTLSHPCRTCCP